MNGVIFFIVGLSLIHSVEFQFNKTAHGFPKVIWSYWQQGIDSAPIFSKLCMANKDAIADAAGWKSIHLSKKNLHNYIDPREVERYFQMSEVPTRSLQMKADLIRLLLVMKYGGLWIDVGSYFLTDLQWAENPNKTLIHNKFSSSPDIILGAFTYIQNGGGLITLSTHSSNQVVNVFPYYENWMILAKPNSQFLHEWLKMYTQVCTKTKKKMDEQNLENGIIIPPLILNAYFIGSDFSQQVVLQRKQKQLWAKNSTQYAVEHYNIWHIEAHQSAFKIFIDYNEFVMSMWADQSTYSTQQLEMQSEIPFFRKYIGWQHRFFSNYLRNYASYNCWGLDFIVQESSEIKQKLFMSAWNKEFMKDISQLHANIANASFCLKVIEKDQREYSFQPIINILHWLFILAIVLAVWFLNIITNKKDKPPPKHQLYESIEQ